MAARKESERFSIQLGMVVPESELVAWFEQAQAGDAAVYASGFVLPREAAAVKLAGAWGRAGLVHLTQARDPAEPRRWLWRCERSSAGPKAARPRRDFREDLTRTQMRRLLDELRVAADRGAPCPSRSALAREVCGVTAGDRRIAKARDRVGYLLRRLVDERRIAMVAGDATRPPVVTILAKGRGCGKSTASSSAAVGRKERTKGVE